MCILCEMELMKNLTIKERLNAANELIRDAVPGEELTHVTEVWNKSLKDYADEISKEVLKKQHTQLSFEDYVEDWDE